MSWLVEVVTDATFANPVFTATVMRSARTVGTTASVQCTTPLQSGKSYSWRVSSRDAFGSITTPTRAFHVQ
jgi:hypothetical protein